MISQRFDDTNLEDHPYHNKGNSNLEHWHIGTFIHYLIVFAQHVYVLGLDNFFYVNFVVSSPSSFSNSRNT